MGEILKELLNLFRGDEPRLWKILKFVFTLAVVFIVVVALESAMGLITIGRLERRINLLKELNTLTETGLGSQNQLEDIFNKTVSNLEQYNPDLRYTISNMLPENNQPKVIEELLPAASIWILIAIYSLVTTKGLLSKLMVAGFFTIVGLVMGYIASRIIETPYFFESAILGFCIGISPLILIIILMYKPNPQKQSQSKSD